MLGILAIVLGAMLLTGCGGTIVSEVFTDVGRSVEEGCMAAVQAAAEMDATQDEAGDLDEAISMCPTLFDLEAAVDVYPEAFDGANLRALVLNRCATNVELTDRAVCLEIGE